MSRARVLLCRLGLHHWVDAHTDEGDRYALCSKCGKDDYRGQTAPDEGPNWPGKQW
jgi:hypothetical protein